MWFERISAASQAFGFCLQLLIRGFQRVYRCYQVRAVRTQNVCPLHVVPLLQGKLNHPGCSLCASRDGICCGIVVYEQIGGKLPEQISDWRPSCRPFAIGCCLTKKGSETVFVNLRMMRLTPFERFI